jgi:hypothetical protein
MGREDFIGRAVLEIGSSTGASVSSRFTTVAWAALDALVDAAPPPSVLAARGLAARVAVDIEDGLAAAGHPLRDILQPGAVDAFPTAVNRGLAKAARFTAGFG